MASKNCWLLSILSWCFTFIFNLSVQYSLQCMVKFLLFYFLRYTGLLLPYSQKEKIEMSGIAKTLEKSLRWSCCTLFSKITSLVASFAVWRLCSLGIWQLIVVNYIGTLMYVLTEVTLNWSTTTRVQEWKNWRFLTETQSKCRFSTWLSITKRDTSVCWR